VVTGFRLPYFTLTPTFSVCPSHGYLTGEQQQCPICDAETEVYSRVVGYLRPIKQWNDGKKAEFHMRKNFKMDSRPVISTAGAMASGKQNEKHKAEVLSSHTLSPILVTAQAVKQ
jgi:ribonucleoside-triphosphate reductase